MFPCNVHKVDVLTTNIFFILYHHTNKAVYLHGKKTNNIYIYNENKII